MNDKMTFATELTGSFEMRGKDAPSNAVLGRWWSLVGHFPIAHVVSAIREHDRTNKFLPQPADVIAILETMDGRPGVEEAWGTALRTLDDAVTVVLTDESAIAMSACAEQLDRGDKVAARVAFKEKYTQLVTDARRDMKPVKWIISYGDKPEIRKDAITRAVGEGKLSRKALDLLPSPDNGKVAGLITGKTKSGNVDFDARMAEVRAAMQAKNKAVSEMKSPSVTDAERTAKLKAETERLIEEKAGKLQGE